MAEPGLWSRRRLLACASLAGAAVGLPGCAAHRGLGPAPVIVPPASTIANPRSLQAEAAAHHLLAGFALNVEELRRSETYRRVVAEQCSIAVAENAMKWGALRPAADKFFFDDADALLHFCESNRIRLHGHNLCWHESLPAWFAGTANQSNAPTLLVEHIRTVAGRYAGRIHSWDVVNEAIDWGSGRPDGLRASPWLSLIGEDYIELAFRTAREADPAALLTYNDFGIEGETEAELKKRAAVLLLLRRLKQRNVPIDAVGIQSHLRAGAAGGYGRSLVQFIRSCRELDLEVFVTEIDVDDRALPTDVGLRDRGVAEVYRDYLRLVLAEPNVRAVLAWGVDDPHTWLNHEHPRSDGTAQRPLLFDGAFRAKPAFEATVASFREARPFAAPGPRRASPASLL